MSWPILPNVAVYSARTVFSLDTNAYTIVILLDESYYVFVDRGWIERYIYGGVVRVIVCVKMSSCEECFVLFRFRSPSFFRFLLRV